MALDTTRGDGARGGATDDRTPRTRVTKWLVGVGAVIMLAGLLFGYDQGVIGGALVAGGVADRLGRRRTILAAAVLFSLGAVVEAVAPGTDVLVVGRILVGFGVGVASVAAPLYAAEMAPTSLRGRFVSLYQLAITIGIFLAYLVAEFLAAGDWWRLMLGLSAVPAVLLFLAVLPLPDSPTWYEKVGRRGDAVRALERVRPDEDPDELMAQIAESLRVPDTSWRVVFSKLWRAPLVLGVGLAVMQQLTGINAVIYYADKIFAAAGFSTPQQQTAATTWAIGAVNVLATFIAVAFVDRIGRRPLLLTGVVGMAIGLVTIAICFAQIPDVGSGNAGAANTPSDAGVVMVIAMVVFIASFAFSLGPIVWTVINEIFPSHVRGRAVAVSTAVNWGAAWLVTRYFLTLTESIGTSGTFWLFAVMCVVTYVFVWFRMPETKGRSLDEIQLMWQREQSASTDAPTTRS